MKDIHYPFRHAITLGAVCVALPMTIADAQPVGSTWMIVQTARDPLALVGVARQGARRARGFYRRRTAPSFAPAFMCWAGRAVPARQASRWQAAIQSTVRPSPAVSRLSACRRSIPALPRCATRRSTSGSDIVTTIQSRLLLRLVHARRQ